MAKIKSFAKESDLCDAFIAVIKKPWVAYAETHGWDILLINSVDGRQVGIQAKLKLNGKVLAQAAEMPTFYHAPSPDYRAVLVPDYEVNDLADLAPMLCITVISMRPESSMYGIRSSARFTPELPEDRAYGGIDRYWHECLPDVRCHVPEFVPDCQAGAPAPVQLTRWKIAAMKLDVLLDQTGHLTRKDFQRFGVDIRRWIGVGGWLEATPQGYVKGKRYPDFRRQHPKVWAEILADPAKWSRPVTELAL